MYLIVAAIPPFPGCACKVGGWGVHFQVPFAELSQQI
jgi:hypothetical protein